MSEKRIYRHMLDYRKAADRGRYRITRWKLTDGQARRLAEECSETTAQSPDALYEAIRAGKEHALGAKVVIR